jgi:hypothetical protein
MKRVRLVSHLETLVVLRLNLKAQSLTNKVNKIKEIAITIKDKEFRKLLRHYIHLNLIQIQM